MLSLYLNFSAFAFAASITPGPTNLISLMIGTRRGAPAALPFILGASFSMALILWLSGMGLAPWIGRYPWLRTGLTLAGALWMSYLAWKLAFAKSVTSTQTHRTQTPGWLQGAGLQWVNPKTWMMALSTLSLFALPGADGLHHVSRLALIFFVVAVPCQLVWGCLGQSASRLQQFSRWEAWINRTLALALLLIVWGAVLAD
ncbi:LysE family translocator [Granulosicoccaceae sp. 1_MG-2023]|nr:LysE family translocator [Granulosicoccaceae sp. 1_MG-2023]